MNWSSEKPTQPGWYWYGEPGHDFEKDKECVQVWPGGSVVRPGQAEEDNVRYMSGQFAGPIPEPGERAVLFFDGREIAPISNYTFDSQDDGRVADGMPAELADETTAKEAVYLLWRAGKIRIDKSCPPKP